MELDDFKAAWKSLDAQLARNAAINLHLAREKSFDRTRASLRPLFWGQVLQVAFGAAFVLLAVLLWRTHPQAIGVIVAGILVHAYGIGTIIAAGAVLGGLSGIDYAAPVLAIQQQLATVRRRYVIGGLIAGLAWWFLWLPVLMVLAALVGVDLYARAPGMVWSCLAIGAAGLAVTAAFHRWSQHPSRPGLARAVDDAVTGRSLRRAQAQLAEVRRFEAE